MLTYSEITQLSDKDLCFEVENTRNSLFRQKMGVKTAHLKDTHFIKVLKIYIARLLTELTRRKNMGENVEKTSDEVVKKTQEIHSEIEKKQVVKKKKKAEKTTDNDEKKKSPEADKNDDITEKSSEGVKVRKVEKKGLLKKMFNKKES